MSSIATPLTAMLKNKPQKLAIKMGLEGAVHLLLVFTDHKNVPQGSGNAWLPGHIPQYVLAYLDPDILMDS